MGTATPTALCLCLWLLLILSPAFPSVSAVTEFSLVVSGPTTLQLSPTLVVEKSPGLKPGAKVKCERVLIHGLPRIKHMSKFANSMKVKVSCENQSGYAAKIEICFHRNVSLAVGMCPEDQWERLNKGLWIKSMSPFDHKILDVRTVASYSENLEVSIDEEFFAYRVLFLVLGTALMCVASWLSKSLVFYYSGAMIIGIFLVILMVLFQGMKLLPTGRKSSLAIFLYSCFVGLGSFLLRYLPGLLRSLLVEIGLSEDMYNPLAIFLLVSLAITGAWLGFWVVRKLVLTEDGSIDIGVSHFVTWSIRIVACVMILQSSVDPLLAAEALLGGIVVSSVLRRFAHRKVIRRVYKNLRGLNLGEALDSYTSPVSKMSASRPSTRAPYSPVRGSLSKSPTRLSDSNAFYSTFHETPDRRKFTKGEWESFTKDSTRKALEELVSSPDFSRWAVSHADRITLAPKKETSDRQTRWFRWF
ncbi:hypothetical protein ABFS82_08G059200 [Erythranthe guttata]|uniref:Nuclear envelope integral membrane protein 1 n=1 Tax=Erythranthe guttata TaxID=4155 RepID=A0A022RX28_ERYGU|nr:PREDICTED: uncharacterized protein LOC105973574 [Erythranthe guttata]EYU44506.1 hypothetical protein MIMGU_mgv1a005768mg [Erythranthe guttata]|eukprot:XP_012854065.1 PREDICTED: uncharacterized protein LOC105973574 [Erythranthe guttata]